MNTQKTAYVLLLVAVFSGGAIAHSGGGHGGAGGGGMGSGMADQSMMGQGMMGPGMMGMMSADELTDEQLDKISEQMLQLHEQMEIIANAKAPEQRREAVRQHLKNMQAFMHERRDMMLEHFSRAQGREHWQQHMEERMRRMEQMMQGQ